jgi:hypothetical protein
MDIAVVATEVGHEVVEPAPSGGIPLGQVHARPDGEICGRLPLLSEVPCRLDSRVLSPHARRADPVTVETVGIGPVLVGWSVPTSGLRTRGRTRQVPRPG